MGGIRTDTWGRTDVARPVRRRRGRLQRRAGRQSPGVELAARVPGLRRSRRRAALFDDAHHTLSPGHTRALPQHSDVPPAEQPPGRHRPARSSAPDWTPTSASSANRAAWRAWSPSCPEPAAEPVSPTLVLASLIARAALHRQESRGAHFRTDSPELDPAWRGRIHWRRAHAARFEEVLS